MKRRTLTHAEGGSRGGWRKTRIPFVNDLIGIMQTNDNPFSSNAQPQCATAAGRCEPDPRHSVRASGKLMAHAPDRRSTNIRMNWLFIKFHKLEHYAFLSSIKYGLTLLAFIIRDVQWGPGRPLSNRDGPNPNYNSNRNGNRITN